MSTDHFDTTELRNAALAFDQGSRWARRFSRIVGARIAVDLYLAAEAMMIFGLGLAIAEIYVRGWLGVEVYLGQYLAPLVLVPLLSIAYQRNRKLTDFTSICRFSATIGRVFLSLILAFATVIVLGFMAGIANDFSRVWYVSWLLATGGLVLVARAVAARLFQRMAASGFIRKTIAIYGDDALGGELADEIEDAGLGIRIAGRFGPRQAQGTPCDVSCVSCADGDIDELVAFGQNHHLDTIIVATNALPQKDLEKLLIALSVLPAEVQLYLGFGNGSIPIRGVSSLNQLRLLDIQRKPISDWGFLAKTIEDYAVATVSLILFAPVLIGAAIAIKLDSKGPVFFRQRRHGFNHEVINVFKFRTMRVMEDGDAFRQAVRGDPRVTRVGRFLRKTSIDELPQLFNVLMGDMSVVGPRPHPIALNDQYAGILAKYETRHRVKPGITGWAQINGFRGPTDEPELMKKRIEYDLEYIEKWSVWMDLKILAATPLFGIVHKNAL